MRITLVHPAGFNFVPGQPDFSVLANRMVPIGILTLAAWLEKHGHPTEVHDCLGPRSPSGTAANAEIILATNPEIVGFSVTTSAFMDAVEITSYIKKKRPDIKVVYGNVHVSSIGAPLLDHFPEIDYLVIGEGEGSMLDLAEGKPPGEIPNLVYRDGGRNVSNPRRARILNLDELPFPAYEKLKGFPEGYHLPLFSYEKRWGGTMVTSRGCPYTCSFCDRTVFERLYKYNSAQYIYDHMKHLRDNFGVYHINFYDDLFTAQKKRVTELCNLLIENPLGMHFNCAIRTGHTSDEMLAHAEKGGRADGLHGHRIGRPGNDGTPQGRRDARGGKEDGRADSCRWPARQGTVHFRHAGRDAGNRQGHQRFHPLARPRRDEHDQVQPALRGARSGTSARAAAGNFNEDWRLMNCLNFVYLPEGFSSREEMDALYNWHVRRFYDSKGYRRRFAKRIWEHRWSLWHLVKNLPRVIQAMRYFSANQKELEAIRKNFPLHARQPQSLEPLLGPELRIQPKQAKLATHAPVEEKAMA